MLSGVGLLFNTFTALTIFLMPIEGWGDWLQKIAPFEWAERVLSVLVGLFALALLCAVPPATGLRRRAYAMIGSLVLIVVAVLAVFVALLLGAFPRDARLLPTAVVIATIVCGVVVLGVQL